LQTLCVGVAGGSGSGKTTLVRRLSDLFSGDVALLEQDAYYQDRSSVAAKDRPSINFDHPDAIEADLLVDHVRALRFGAPVEAPVYDFVTHTRCGTRKISPAPILLVEGILVLHWPDLRHLMDVTVFVDQTQEARLGRRTARDVAERGRTAESVAQQFAGSTVPMHDIFVEPCKEYALWIVKGDASGEEQFCKLAEYIRRWLMTAKMSGLPNTQA